MTRRRMRSKTVAMGSVVALAVLFSACGGEEEQVYCVDENDEVVDNDQCDESRSGGGGAFFWYFGGRALGGGGVGPGTRLTGGGSDAKVSPSDTSRLNDRGFGSSARSSSGIGGTAKTGGFSLGGGS